MDQRIKNFAKLAVTVGVNVQPGEDVIISSPIESPELARLITEAAYEIGARRVTINWYDDVVSRLNAEFQSLETYSEVPDYLVEKSRYELEKHRSNRISIYAEDPDLFEGLDEEKISKASRERSLKMKEFVKYTMNDIVSWLVISVPTRKWAMKVFPDLSAEEAYDKLWEVILDVSRVEETWEATEANWKEHVTTLNSKAKFLNEHQFDKVHYQSSNGTDLVVELPLNHIWTSADSNNEKGDAFVPNIPTEEVFTSPKKTGVNGRLVATKPLVYNGVTINHFEFTFENGRVVDFKAEQGEETLKQMLESDENARYLGEIALVPHNSPISNSNILFYNTLFDENASCHFALGKAYPTTVKGGTELEDDELESIGLNDALIHEDFMVGAPDLSIKGYKGDEEFDIFIDGNWA